MDRENPAKPYMPQNPFGVKQEYWERIQNMRLLDDTFMSAAFDNNIEATQLMLRLMIGKEDLKVISAKAQVEYKNLYGHSLRMDVDAVDSDGDRIDIEVERTKSRAHPKRMRYHSAIRDVSSLERGQDFMQLPTSYVVIITEEDYWKEGRPLYHIDRVIRENGKNFGDSTHIIYANAAYHGDDPFGLLMADFRQRDPRKMHYPELAQRVDALKNSEEEVKRMCQAMEITYQEGLREGIWKGYARSVLSLMENQNLSIDEAMDVLNVPENGRQICAGYIVRQQTRESN